jgi:SWI/SNF-related matrix-associated actin-dependent regulator of chromatin subfamily B protein 1
MRSDSLFRPSKIAPEEANRLEQLVPIRLEFDVDHHKMRDTFTWNLAGEHCWLLAPGKPTLTRWTDPVVTPEAFAQSIIDDYGLAQTHHATITKLIQEQLSDYKAHAAPVPEQAGDDVAAKPGHGTIDVGGEDAAWWDAWRARTAARAGRADGPRKRRKVSGEESEDEPYDIDGFEADEGEMDDEMRIVIKVSVVIM